MVSKQKLFILLSTLLDLYLCRACLLAVHVGPQPKVLQICWLVLHFVREWHHLLGGRGLQGQKGTYVKQRWRCVRTCPCVCVYKPEMSWAAGAPGWMECLPGRGSARWGEDPWVWAGSQSPPGSWSTPTAPERRGLCGGRKCLAYLSQAVSDFANTG